MRLKNTVSLMGLLLCAASAPAAVTSLTWDPLGNGGSTSGSGNWDTNALNKVWYNGTTDVPWTQSNNLTYSYNTATFNGPDAAPNTYVVSIDVGQIAVTNNLYINNNGYVFAASGTNGIYLGANTILSVAPGKTVTFNCAMDGSGSSPAWELGAGATMNVNGSLQNAQQIRMAGAANSVINLTGANSAIAIPYILTSVNVTAGTLATTGNFFVGYPSLGYSTGTLTVSGSGVVNENGGIFIVSRSGGQGTVILQNGGTINVGTTKSEPLAISYQGNAGDLGLVNVQGGTLNVGSSAFTTSAIAFYDTGASAASATEALTQSGGIINAWGGITFSLGGGSGAAALTNSGGILNIGVPGITKGAAYTGPMNITLTGGTVGTLANWSSSLPMTLGTANGNITFNCVNNITLSGALTDGGSGGGLFVTGGGILTLSGANNFSGSTVVSNGTLAVVTGSTPTISGSVTLDGSTGTPIVSVVATAGQYWTNNGSLTYLNNSGGTPTADFQFGGLAPSTSVAPVQVNGNVNFTVTPSVTVEGSAIAVGTYPLIKYTGSIQGTMPTSASITLSGGSASGTVSNNAATKTIVLVVSSSTYNPALSWRVGNGIWDINTTPNWTQFGSAADYQDGDAVLFDDTASGSSPITVTLNTTVNPLAVTANNSAKNYTITGSGNITGGSVLSVLNTSTLTLATANTYSGGTTINAGQLNINNGGNGAASAIGIGPLTINGGSLDNTSGADVTLQPSIPENWNGNFTYVGSANNFNTGSGPVTLNGNYTLAVNAKDFIVSGGITDNDNNYTVTKSGSGTLSLPVGSAFLSGGVTLTGGLLNIGDQYALGDGVFTVNAPNGCSIDNTSGGAIILQTSAYTWGTGFEFLGSASLDFGPGPVTGNTDPLPVYIQVDTNTLSTEGALTFGNVLVYKTGAGTWVIGGASANSLNLIISAGQVDFAKTKSQAVSGTRGLTISAGAMAQDEQPYQMHSDTKNSPETVALQGGTWDLNGNTENVDILALSSGGTLETSASGTACLTNISGYNDTLSGLCYFDVVTNSGVLNLAGIISGDGTETLVKTGLGTLNLCSNNIYTGGTVISNGTLALFGAGSISNTALINLATNSAILDLSSNTVSQTLALQSGQTLAGFGTVNGLVQAASGAVVAPGSASVIGTLTVTGAGVNTLNGTTTMKLDKGHSTSDQLAVSGSLVYGGTLALSNLSGSLAVGDTFTLFPGASGYSGAFAAISPATPGSGLSWNTSKLAVNGTLSIAVGAAAPPGFSTLTLSGTTLSIHGTNGPANQSFVLLGTTNLVTPVQNWTPLLTNAFDGSGNFNVSISATNAAEFLLLQTK